ncbi:hypothetical protein Ancab_007515 [Ancistrocladus abbreviatus]
MGESADGLNQEFDDQEQQGYSNLESPETVTCTTFNILAPIYKRISGGHCESEFRECWYDRNEHILDGLLQLKSSIICLQEFWVANEDLRGMYEKRLGDAGYLIYKLARTNNRGDGLLTAVQQNQFRVLNYRELLFNDVADRVAQILHVELYSYTSQTTSTNVVKEALIVNTHLIFPHDFRCCFLRLQQVYKILQYIKSYSDKCTHQSLPIILCGDWNGSKRGHVYKFLRSQGFVSSYDVAHPYADDDDDAEGCQKWVSHRNHRGNICGVDFIWLLNPHKLRKPLKESFEEALLGSMKSMLHRIISEGGQIPEILKMKGSCMTYSEFCQAIRELGIIGQLHGGLSTEDMEDLWEYLDTDGDGIADLTQVGRSGILCTSLQCEEGNKENGAETERRTLRDSSGVALGFVVKKATLSPNEVEKGLWPENYTLSDHALLTVEFVPVEIHCA